MVKDFKKAIKKLEKEMMEDIDLMEELADGDDSGSGGYDQYEGSSGQDGGDGDSEECNIQKKHKKRKTWQAAALQIHRRFYFAVFEYLTFNFNIVGT